MPEHEARPSIELLLSMPVDPKLPKVNTSLMRSAVIRLKKRKEWAKKDARTESKKKGKKKTQTGMRKKINMAKSWTLSIPT